MRILNILVTLFLSLTLLQAAHGQEVPSPSKTVREHPSRTLKENAERGWFFYEREKQLSNKEDLAVPQPEDAKGPPTQEELCSKKETWTTDCGFVDPGKDFEFQAKQRDALLQAMSMSKNDPQAVEKFQYYMKWLMERSIEVANLWQYNLVQNPELDANVKAPISTFGLKLMTEVRDDREESILAALKEEGAFLLYFSRYDCPFCHAMTSTIQSLESRTGLEIWNATLDGKCMPTFEERCKVGERAVAVAQALQVAIVPTLFLYVPGAKSEEDTWIRIATGVTDMNTMRGRVVSFFSAYRTALLKGVANGSPGRAPVDFSENTATGTAAGVAPAPTAPRLPTEEEIKKLFAQ